jgi:hypothetical protein
MSKRFARQPGSLFRYFVTGILGTKFAEFFGGLLVQRYSDQQYMNSLQHHQEAVEHYSLHLRSEALARPFAYNYWEPYDAKTQNGSTVFPI